MANSVFPDQMLHSAASDQGLLVCPGQSVPILIDSNEKIIHFVYVGNVQFTVKHILVDCTEFSHIQP